MMGGSRGIAPLILNSSRWRWVVNITSPLPFYPRERTPVPIDKRSTQKVINAHCGQNLEILSVQLGLIVVGTWFIHFTRTLLQIIPLRSYTWRPIVWANPLYLLANLSCSISEIVHIRTGRLSIMYIETPIFTVLLPHHNETTHGYDPTRLAVSREW